MDPDDKDQITFPFVIEPTKNDYVIRKHKGIIHRTHFPTAVEEKIFNGFLLAAKVAFKTGDIDTFRKDGFLTSDKFIRNFSGLKIKDKDYVIERINTIQTSLIRFDYFDQFDTFKELRTFQPITEVRFLDNGGIRFFLPPSLLEAVADPETFATIDTQITSRFTCVYAIVLYEMGILHIGSSFEFKTLKEFRDYMGLEPDEYPKSTDLRRYVIEKGCGEVNSKSAIHVEYELIKEGRGNKVTGVRFDFTEAPEPLEIPSSELQLHTIAKFIAMLPFELSGEQFVVTILKKKLDEHGEAWVLSNVEAFLSRLNAPGQPPVNKPGALFRTTFKFDYGEDVRNAKRVAEILAQQEQERLARANETKGNKATQENLKQEQEQLEAQKKREREAKYIAYFEALSEAGQEEVMKGLELIRKRSDPSRYKAIGTKEAQITYYLSEELQIAL
jgi:hypothetical protein